MSVDTEYKTEAPGANGYGTTAADLDAELGAMKIVVNALNALSAALGDVGDDGLQAVLTFADSRYARATKEFRPAKIERATRGTAKTKK